MFATLLGIALGIFICLFIPPKDLAIKIITATITVCNFLIEKGKEQLEKIEKEKENDQDDKRADPKED
jgi:hypothetical protein